MAFVKLLSPVFCLSWFRWRYFWNWLLIWIIHDNVVHFVRLALDWLFIWSVVEYGRVCRIVIVLFNFKFLKIHFDSFGLFNRLFYFHLLLFWLNLVHLGLDVVVCNNTEDPLAQACCSLGFTCDGVWIKVLAVNCSPHWLEIALWHLQLLDFLCEIKENFHEFLRNLHDFESITPHIEFIQFSILCRHLNNHIAHEFKYASYYLFDQIRWLLKGFKLSEIFGAQRVECLACLLVCLPQDLQFLRVLNFKLVHF